jgi:hypothetical protein
MLQQFFQQQLQLVEFVFIYDLQLFKLKLAFQLKLVFLQFFLQFVF